MRGPQGRLTRRTNLCHYPRSKENSWAISLILAGLLLPSEQASCHCQGQTLCQDFCPESGHIYSPPCSTHLNSHHTSCSFAFLFLSSSLRSSVILCPTNAQWANIQPLMWACAHTHSLFKFYICFFSPHPDFTHSCSVKVFLFQLINHLKCSELAAHASTNRILTWCYSSKKFLSNIFLLSYTVVGSFQLSWNL